MDRVLRASGYVGIGFLFGLAVKTIFSSKFEPATSNDSK